jgi:hypothetical protein
MPNIVKRALTILLATLGVECARQLVLLVRLMHHPGAGVDSALVAFLFPDGIAVLVIYNIYRRRNWARIVLGIDLFLIMLIVTMARWHGKTPFLNVQQASGWLWLVEWLANTVALVFLFFPSARAWFAGNRENEIVESATLSPVPLSVLVLWRRLTYVSIGIFVLAMTQTAYYEAASDPARNSAMLLLIGWMGVLVGYIEWIANPLLFYSWFSALHRRYWEAVGSATLALVLILSFLRRSEVVWIGDNGSKAAAIRGYALGYWLWLASSAVMIIAGLAHLARPRRRTD